MKFLKHPITILTLLFAGVAGAGAIKTWVAGEPLTAAQLNAAFQHLHNTMVGGHGARLVNADVSGSAAIESGKLAQGNGIVDNMVRVGATGAVCSASPCLIYEAVGVSSVTRGSAGIYTVTFSASISSAAIFIVSGHEQVTSSQCAVITSSPTGSVTTVEVRCHAPGGAATDTAFSLIAIDP